MRLAGRRLEVGGALGPFLQGFLSGPLQQPVPDGLQAVLLLADGVAALRGTLVRPSPRELHDPEGHSGVRFGVEAVQGLWAGHQGLLLLWLGHLGRRDKISQTPDSQTHWLL